MEKVYFISDMHFGHTNIMKYENRPFDTVEEMDNTIIENWNKVINKNDLIFVLGDVSFYSKELTYHIIHKLHGRKILIIGNHDKSRSLTWWGDVGFNIVYHYPIIYNEFYMLSHEPLYVNSNMPYANIHGHIHSMNICSKGEIQQYFNVSVENINYTPISFSDIKSKVLGGTR
jgi:calcineurin-like phosphoesterase family protein